MDSVLKKVLMLGIGIGATTKKKIEELIKELEKKGEINAKEGKKITNDFLKKTKQQTEEIKKIIIFELNRKTKTMPFATKIELKNLEKKIDIKLKKLLKTTPVKKKPKTKNQK